MAKEQTKAPSGRKAVQLQAGDGTVYEVAKIVTRPILKFEGVGGTIMVKIEAPHYLGKELKQGRGEKASMEPAHLFDVVDLSDGEEKQLIANAVLRSTFDDTYPNNEYVGKAFAIT